MPQEFQNENDAFINILTDGSGYFSAHLEQEPIGDAWAPTGRFHVYLYRKVEGVCTFFMEQDAEENWEANDDALPEPLVTEIGERIQSHFEEK